MFFSNLTLLHNNFIYDFYQSITYYIENEVERMKKDILAVDDDTDILHSVKDIFEHQGHEVFTVSNGFECIQELENGFNGIILLDIMMPGMDGWDTIKEIVRKGLDKNVEILIITAIGTSDHDKMYGVESYIHDYIIKPFNVKDLVESVEKIH